MPMSKTAPSASTVVVGIVWLLLGRAGLADAYPVQGMREYSDQWALEAGGRVVVDNLHGGIRVVGADGDVVEMTVRETIRAASPEWATRALGEVQLRVSAEPSTVDLFVDGPFRHRHDRSRWTDVPYDVEYEVVYDFELRVPRESAVDLRTVLDGDVIVREIAGTVEASNVTGAVRLRAVHQVERAESVSGPVEVEYIAQPRLDGRLKTVSGDVEVTLPARASVDARLVTSFGELWSEFEVAALPSVPVRREVSEGRWKLRSGGPRVRIGRGGAVLSIETLSGDIRLRKGGR